MSFNQKPKKNTPFSRANTVITQIKVTHLHKMRAEAISAWLNGPPEATPAICRAVEEVLARCGARPGQVLAFPQIKQSGQG